MKVQKRTHPTLIEQKSGRLSESEFAVVQKQLQSEGQLSFQVVTGSMVPLISVGDFIVVEPVDPTVLKRFDVIVFWRGSVLVCHFVWWKNRFLSPNGTRTFSTGGIRMLDDVVVAEEMILGKVVSHQMTLWYRLMVVALLFWRRFKRRFLRF